jgi:hypothetical protein
MVVADIFWYTSTTFQPPLLQVSRIFKLYLTRLMLRHRQMRHRALLTVRGRGMQNKDGAKLFKDLCVIFLVRMLL